MGLQYPYRFEYNHDTCSAKVWKGTRRWFIPKWAVLATRSFLSKDDARDWAEGVIKTDAKTAKVDVHWYDRAGNEDTGW